VQVRGVAGKRPSERARRGSTSRGIIIDPDDHPPDLHRGRAEVAALLTANRDHSPPTEPYRGDDYFTAGGQATGDQDVLRQYDQDGALPHVIVEDAGSPAV